MKLEKCQSWNHHRISRERKKLFASRFHSEKTFIFLFIVSFICVATNGRARRASTSRPDAMCVSFLDSAQRKDFYTHGWVSPSASSSSSFFSVPANGDTSIELNNHLMYGAQSEKTTASHWSSFNSESECLPRPETRFFSLSYHDDDGRASKGLTSSSRAIPQVDLEWEREILSSLGEAELRAKIESSSGRFAIHFHSAHIRTNSKWSFFRLFASRSSPMHTKY